ncbi:MAG: GlsB/YeaQ/YmgE family stress response membrane protein [Propionibacteriaceae bacterium]|nr:GlsB/YeaQ/YmgE family stress response membrane protein [Propionibacteriaceae bacterium]
MGIISFLLLGLIAGAVARALVPGRIGSGFVSALVCGVVGALVGGWLSSAIFHISLGTFWDLRTWIISIAGSALVLTVWGAFHRSKTN